jgi:large subunit ribosomal protein L10
MARADKVAAVAELTDAFRDSHAALLTEYRGLTVAQLKELRRSLAGNATYAVVKNTLSKIAAHEAGLDTLAPLLEGPSAIAFVSGDPVEVAKGLRDFGRDNPRLVVKGGVLEGQAVSAAEIRRLADLESREVLLAKLAGGLQASLQQAVSLFAAPLSQAARVIAALQAAAEADPTVLSGAGQDAPAPASEPVADSAPEPAAAETATPADEPATEGALPTDGTPGIEPTPSDPAAEAAGDDGGVAQAVADAVDIPPSTDVTGDATSAS